MNAKHGILNQLFGMLSFLVISYFPLVLIDFFLFLFIVSTRLLSWAGKRIEPYGVEYILNKLGFSQARTTIPKWVQRGAMDPLDKILSLVLSRTITAQKAKESQTANSTLTSGVVTGGGNSSGAGVGSNNTINATRSSMK
jgi:hypothetical protein